MIKIIHRVNKVTDLKKVMTTNGVEIDLRSRNNEIILHHDPFENGVKFKDWLKHYKHRFMVLNVKEEGLEERILEILKRYKIKKFFFHDQTFSSMIKNMQYTNVSIRFSEFEEIKCKNKLFKYIKWLWIDNFTRVPLNKKFFNYINKKEVKICIVSPELIKMSRVNEIINLKKKLKKMKIKVDAVCTKNPDLWN